MHKIFNWTLGSFFRTAGRFIFYLLLGYLISMLIDFKSIKLPNLWTVLDVYADEYQVYTGYPNETDEYIANINNQFYSSLGLTAFNRAISYNCSGSSSCTGSISNQDLTSGGLVWNGSMANYGFDVAHDTFSILTSNHLYSYSYVFCVPSGITDFENRLFINSGLSSSRASQQNLLTSDWYALSNITWYNYDSSGANNVATNKCYSTYNLFNYSGSSAYTIKFNLHTSSFTNRYIGVLGYKLTDLGATNGLTSNQVQSIINNSGLATANSITDVQSSINDVQNQLDDVNSSIQDQIDADAQNTQDIIDNQNQNSQNQIDSQKVCSSKILTYNDIKTANAYLVDGTDTWSNEYGITDYLEVSRIRVKNIVGWSPSVCFYTSDKTLISCIPYRQLSENQYITIPNNTKYTRFSIRNDNKPQFDVNICQNGNQGITDAITDDSAPSNIDALANSAGWLPAGAVDSVLNLPLSFLTNLNSNLSKSCQPAQLPLPYVNETLELPCINSLYAQIEGLPAWINTIGIIASAFILFGYLINLYKYIDDTLTFRENNYIDNWSGV